MNSVNKKDLYILTDEYPYGYCEYSFIRTELEELKKYYNIIFVSKIKEKKTELQLDEGMRAYHNSMHFGIPDKIAAALAMVFSADGREEIKAILKEKQDMKTRFYISLSFFGVALKTKKLLDGIIRKCGAEPLIYSYWFSEQCLGALMLKKRYRDLKVVSRIHGYDLYDERWIGNRHPFRKQMDERIDRLFFIAQSGKEYYSSVLGKTLSDDKYIYAPIGTQREKEPQKRDINTKEFVLVSCSSCLKLKRIDLIIEALGLITENDISKDRRIRWIHFGTGELFDELNQRAAELLNKSRAAEYELKGFTRNEDILGYYAQGEAGCFITTSSTEGSPVSIQEAMSYGIPVIGTDVGEIPNLIKDCGYVISSDADPETIKETILKAYRDSLDEGTTSRMRDSAISKWEAEYNAVDNANEFTDKLINL